MKHIIGFLCPSMPDGPLIPPHALTDPCGKDRAVWSDGTISDVSREVLSRETGRVVPRGTS